MPKGEKLWVISKSWGGVCHVQGMKNTHGQLVERDKYVWISEETHVYKKKSISCSSQPWHTLSMAIQRFKVCTCSVALLESVSILMAYVLTMDDHLYFENWQVIWEFAQSYLVLRGRSTSAISASRSLVTHWSSLTN